MLAVQTKSVLFHPTKELLTELRTTFSPKRLTNTFTTTEQHCGPPKNRTRVTQKLILLSDCFQPATGVTSDLARNVWKTSMNYCPTKEQSCTDIQKSFSRELHRLLSTCSELYPGQTSFGCTPWSNVFLFSCPQTFHKNRRRMLLPTL